MLSAARCKGHQESSTSHQDHVIFIKHLSEISQTSIRNHQLYQSRRRHQTQSETLQKFECRDVFEMIAMVSKCCRSSNVEMVSRCCRMSKGKPSVYPTSSLPVREELTLGERGLLLLSETTSPPGSLACVRSPSPRGRREAPAPGPTPMPRDQHQRPVYPCHVFLPLPSFSLEE